MRHLVAAGVQMRRRGLTGEQVEEAKQLYEKGLTIAEVAAQVESAFSIVRSALVAQGCEMRARGWRPVPTTVKM